MRIPLHERRSRPDLNPLRGGFTMVELLVAMAIGAAVLTVAVMVFQNVAGSRGAKGSYVTLNLGESVVENFYGVGGETIDAWTAPNYGRRANADLLRDRFWEDIDRAVAVFCLGRASGVLNNTRPGSIPVSAGLTGQSIDLPETFRGLLASAIPDSSATFTGYRGASGATNASIFVLQPSEDETELSVLAVYDIDLVAVANPPGTYASVRRYVGGVLTDFYDVFYPEGDGATPFNPLIVAFERAARISVDEGASVDRLKLAAGRPFYFVWWPDPAAPDLEAATVGSFGSADPRASFAGMGGRTSLFFVVPMFPAL